MRAQQFAFASRPSLILDSKSDPPKRQHRGGGIPATFFNTSEVVGGPGLAPYYNGYGFYPANENPGVISTLPVTLTTGQTVNFPVGVFMSKVNNSQGNMYVTVPNNASLTSSGFECVANYGSQNTGLQCTFIDGTVLLFAVELWSQVASTGFAQVSCLNPGCVCDGFMYCSAN